MQTNPTPPRYRVVAANGDTLATAHTPSRALFFLAAFRAQCPTRTYEIWWA